MAADDTQPATDVANLEELDRDAYRLADRKKELPVALTDEEWTDYSERCAATWGDIEARRDAEQERRRKWSTAQKELEAEHTRLARIVRDRNEPRKVAIRDYGVGAENQAITVRLDTLEIIERRALTSAERERVLQPTLLEGGKRPDEDSDPPPANAIPYPRSQEGRDLLSFVTQCRAIAEGGEEEEGWKAIWGKAARSQLLEWAGELGLDLEGLKLPRALTQLAEVLAEQGLEASKPKGGEEPPPAVDPDELPPDA